MKTRLPVLPERKDFSTVNKPCPFQDISIFIIAKTGAFSLICRKKRNSWGKYIIFITTRDIYSKT